MLKKMCQMSFDSVDDMLQHFNYKEHDYVTTSVTQLSKVADKWVNMFAAGDSKSVVPSSSRSSDIPCVSVRADDGLGYSKTEQQKFHT